MAKNDNNRNNNQNGMSLEEAGRKGGEATAENHDREFYEEIGQKGGEARARQNNNNNNNDDDDNDRRGKMSRSEAGRKGGKHSHDND